MTKFRAGDRVRAIRDCGYGEWAVGGGTLGVVDFDYGDDVWVQWDGWDRSWYYQYGDVELVGEANEATDELTALRAFKAMALERYPDLEPKAETDEEAAKRMAAASSIYDEEEVERVALAAIAWARANPPA